MKFSIAASLLLSAPVIAYTPNNFNSKTSLNKPSSSALRYVDPSAEDEVHVFGLAEVDLTSALSIKEDRVTAALAVSLGVSDDDVRFEYANWMMRYNKPADETRYTTFKKNILLQAQYNREHGQNFSLNEYGDLTEEEYHQLKANAAAVVVRQPQLIEEEIEIIEEPGTVEIVDETEDLTAKYATIESVEERAFEVLKDMGFVKPAPQHFSFSYVDEVPELRMENGSSYMDALGNPDAALSGAGSMASYLTSMPSSDSGTFAKGKTGNKLGATTSYLDEICDMIEPFLDLEKTCAKGRGQVKSVAEIMFQSKFEQIKNLGDKAFQILADLCMVGRCKK